MRLTLLGKKGRAAVTFGQRLKVLCIEWVDSTKRSLVQAYAERRPGLKEICSYLVDIC
jgi:hypothetical protein